jgi:hypothetical protein
MRWKTSKKKTQNCFENDVESEDPFQWIGKKLERKETFAASKLDNHEAGLFVFTFHRADQLRGKNQKPR